ncbi:EamA family transporter [Clostridium sp. AWRP]|uniref:DMT family transporter n=1 Tax=Clostridium sp. AWRP TaxID=2212991 RepID=UPI000FD8A587|nr:EamA family transporter [Clostridium sp. AWRP]AZV55636.1 EamA family transporter [Clostridium sp. AWRP]
MKKGYLFIILTALFYSTSEVAGRILAQRGKMDPFQVMFIVFLIGAILLCPLAVKDIKVRKLRIGLNDLKYFAICGLMAVTISMVLLQYAVTYTKASTAAVLFCTNAVFTIPFAYFMLKEKITKITLISMLISLAGVIVILNPMEVVSGLGGGKDLVGILFALGSAITWSFYTVLSKKRINIYGGYVFNFFAFCFGVAALLFILVVTKKPIFSGITLSNILVLLYMGIFIKALGYIFYLGAIKETSAVTASMVFLIKPALATIFSILILNENVHVNLIIGIVCIFIGSFINFKGDKNTNELKARTKV